MTTTLRPIRTSDVARVLGKILGKDNRGEYGWDVVEDNGYQVHITLNYLTEEKDDAARAAILERAAHLYRETGYDRDLGDYSWLPEEYNHCALMTLVRVPETPKTPAAPAYTPTVTEDATAVTVDLPAAFDLWFADTGLALGQDDRDPECKETRLAYDAGTPTATEGRTVTATPTVLRLLAEYVMYLREANNDDPKADEIDACTVLTARLDAARAALTTAQESRPAPQERLTVDQAAASLLVGLTVDHHGAARTVTGYDTDADGTVHVALDDDEHAPLDDVAVTDADHDTFAARVHAHPTA